MKLGHPFIVIIKTFNLPEDKNFCVRGGPFMNCRRFFPLPNFNVDIHLLSFHYNVQ